MTRPELLKSIQAHREMAACGPVGNRIKVRQAPPTGMGVAAGGAWHPSAELTVQFSNQGRDKSTGGNLASLLTYQ